MDELGVYCSVLKFKNETPGMFCTGGKVKLQQLHPLHEPISTLVSGIETFLGRHMQTQFMFPNDIVRCNKYCVRELHANIKVQGQIYNRAGSLLPLLDADHKFISWETLMNNSINVPDSVLALNDNLSLHYKLYSMNTTNEFKRLKFSALLAFAMTINKIQGQSPQV